MAGWLAKILEAPIGPVVDYFKTRAQLKSAERVREMELEDALHKRRLELISQGLTADMNWEMEFAQQARTSWKDEATFIVVAIPATLCFLQNPWVAGDVIVAKGFDALAKTPAWYQLLLLTVFFANYGIRYWRRTQSDT